MSACSHHFKECSKQTVVQTCNEMGVKERKKKKIKEVQWNKWHDYF